MGLERNVLHGVTRRSLLEIAAHDGRPARIATVPPEALFEAAEVFLSGTTAGVLPVISIDEKPVGDGRPGPVSVALRDRYHAITRGEDAAFLHDAPHTLPISRPDEVKAAKEPVLRWRPQAK